MSTFFFSTLEKGRVGEVYNLGGHNERNNHYIVKRILSELGKPESLIEFVADRHGHDQRYAIDPAKANKELGWDPITTFEVVIKRPLNGIYLLKVLNGLMNAWHKMPNG